MYIRRGIITFFSVTLVLGGFGALLWLNAQPTAPLRPVIPTQSLPTAVGASWQDVLQAGLNAQGTAVPTIAIPDQNYIPPTLPSDAEPSATPAAAADLALRPQPTFASGATPTPPPPTAFGDDDTGVEPVPTRDVQPDRPVPTNPPSLDVPLARHPFDHYYFIRPIDSNKRNYGLTYYEYGTNGANDEFKIHHGIDMPNDIGTTIRAAGSGIVIYASDESGIFQNSPSYGGVVVIEHDFSFQGQPLYTLYGHIEQPLVSVGEVVAQGDPVALLGNTGRSTGPHVQFEVRLGENSYGSTYNPVLWMAPYVNHGVVAGKVIDSRGNYIDDADVTLSRGGFIRDTTTTYTFRDVGSRVNVDPNWAENFVLPDVPSGTYTVEAKINGQRVSQIVEVQWGMTNFVVLQPDGLTELSADTTTPAPDAAD